MKKIINWIVNNFEQIYISILFLISFLIVAFLFPGEGNFRYEFQKGQPWLHENLVAPFDFAIYPDKNHGIYGGNTRLHLYNKMTNFIKENL